ncbi:MAG: diguanylate cyclase [Caldisericum exile]|uniref:Diguanylate cyclase n=2 Tax=Caldisericaceae TaxID=693073 RepID=A0A2J6WET1_9BACT|nr:MAG: diguanylate cyclase [Caldisericum exile]
MRKGERVFRPLLYVEDSMKQYITRRILILIPELFAITFIAFIFYSLMGDPFAELRANPFINQSYVQYLEKAYGFDKPVIVRYFFWLSQILRGNFGISAVTGEKVIDLIKRAMPITLSINIFTFTFSLVVGVIIGFFTALRQRSFIDNFFTVLSYIGLAMPTFWFALMLMILFSVKFHWLPPGGFMTPGMENAPFFARFLDRLKYIVMPFIVLGFGGLTGWVRYTRSSVLEMLKKDYVRTARAKGLPESVVLRKHVFRNSLNPIVTLFFLSFPGFFSGSAIVEQIFSIPGMGSLVIGAVMNNDYMVAMASLVFYSTVLVLSLLIADIAYVFLDPRVKFS